MSRSKTKAPVRASFLAAVALAWLVPSARAGIIVTHVTDGQFTSGNEWTTGRSTVTEVSFPVVGNSGGANLFVEQQGGVLYLMYGYTHSSAWA